MQWPLADSPCKTRQPSPESGTAGAMVQRQAERNGSRRWRSRTRRRPSPPSALAGPMFVSCREHSAVLQSLAQVISRCKEETTRLRPFPVQGVQCGRFAPAGRVAHRCRHRQPETGRPRAGRGTAPESACPWTKLTFRDRQLIVGSVCQSWTSSARPRLAACSGSRPRATEHAQAPAVCRGPHPRGKP